MIFMYFTGCLFMPISWEQHDDCRGYYEGSAMMWLIGCMQLLQLWEFFCYYYSFVLGSTYTFESYGKVRDNKKKIVTRCICFGTGMARNGAKHER